MGGGEGEKAKEMDKSDKKCLKQRRDRHPHLSCFVLLLMMVILLYAP